MSSTTTPVPPLFWVCFAIGFPLFFAFIWCFVCAQISLLSGWYRLGGKFRAPEGFQEGRLFTGQSGRMSIANYNHVLTMRVAPQGLFISCMAMFRFMHPPLLIPWGEIHNIHQKKILWATMTYFNVGSPSIATIGLLNPTIFEAAQPMMSNQPNAVELQAGNAGNPSPWG